MWYNNCFFFQRILLFALLSSTFKTTAQTPITQPFDFVPRIWNNQSGLPQNTVFDLVHDGEGYLWGGTEEGIFRFDGSEFNTINETNTPDLYSDAFYDLLPSSKGIWASSRNCILLLKRTILLNIDFRKYLTGGWIKCMEEDAEGNLWIGTSGGALFYLKGQQVFSCPKWKTGFAGSIETMLRTPHGMLVATTSGLYSMRNTQAAPLANAFLHNIHITSLAMDAHQKLWAGTGNKGLYELGKDTVHYHEKNGLNEGYINTLRLDSQGKLWIGLRSAGYQILDNNRLITPPQSKYSHDGVRSILFGKNDMIWMGTNSTGLIQLKQREINMLEGNPASGNIILPIYQQASGTIWVGTAGKGLFRIHHGNTSNYTKENGLSNNLVLSLAASKEYVFVGTSNGLDRFNLARNNFDRHYNEKDGLASTGILSLFYDSRNRLWMGTRNGGLYQMNTEGEIQRVQLPASVGNSNVLSVLEDRNGNIWLGTRGSGLIKVDSSGIAVQFHAKRKFPADIVYSIFEDEAGEIWTATDKGLIAFNKGNFVVLNKERGLIFNEIYRILKDPAGFLWLSGNSGLQRLSLADAQRAKKNTSTTVKLHVKQFNSFDGMDNAETNGGFFPAGWAMNDGTLWFPTSHGIAIANHQRVKNILRPISIHLQMLQYGHKQHLPSDSIRIPPGVFNMEILYTSIDFSKAADITYHYRLKGLSNDWVDAGNRRRAYFSELAPGDYVFEVKAEQYGNWSTVATLPFTVNPHFHQALWFKILIGLIFATVVFLFIRMLKNEAKRKYTEQQNITKAQINGQEKERQLIGSELHDNINQQLTTAKVYLDFARTNEAMRSSLIEKSEEVIQTVINDVRALSKSLTPPGLKDIGLEEALEDLLGSYSSVGKIKTHFQFTNNGVELEEDLQFALFRMTQEQMTNIIKHANASNVWVQFTASGNQILLRIADDGQGLPPVQVYSSKKGMGLQNIKNRLALYNGSMELQSKPGEGCVLLLKIPV